MLETELYPPIKAYLKKNGYQVQAEVKNCDVVATKDNDLIIVELKTSANMTLLIQATARQAISDSVYIAIPRPKIKSRQWSGIKRVVKQLELGLLTIEQSPLGLSIIKHFDPQTGKRRISTAKHRAVIREIEQRSGDYNIGGSSGKKLMTAYKENAILIACGLRILGPSSPKTLRQLGTGDKTGRILASNYYGWFERIQRGVYQLTNQGANDLTNYPEVQKNAKNHLKQSLRA
ncbi:MAG: hypothetical protein KUG79_17560 [Pseudomonadales bacterium]|nr:hypothetical protein [Pseudomonadales bacterium]